MREPGEPTVGEDIVNSVSILDSTDRGDMYVAYCERHEQDMMSEQPVLKWNNALYRVQDPFKIYICDQCLSELAGKADKSVKEVYDHGLIKIFKMWDDGEGPGSWFEYVRDVETDESGDILLF